MSTDPASLNVKMDFTGLSYTELELLLRNAPGNTTLIIDVMTRGLGAQRYRAQIFGMSIQGAAVLSGALHKYLSDLANGE